MFKKFMVIIMLFSVLLIFAGCRKINVSNIVNESSNLKRCQNLCDEEAKMYAKMGVQGVKETCYNNCNEIEAMNERNGTTTTDDETTTTDETTTATDAQKEVQANYEDGILNVEDCPSLCRMSVLTYAEDHDECVMMCKAQALIQSTDINDCKNIAELNEDISESACIAQKAINQGKPEWCDLVDTTEEKDFCYLTMVELKKNKSYCDNIQDPGFKEYCQTTPLTDE